MLGRLIKKEILEHLMSLRFAIACVLCLIVILTSLFVRGRDYGQVSADYHEESAMEKHRIEEIRWPWDLPWEGVRIHRRPNPLKIFVRGVTDANGGTVRVVSHERLQPVIRDVQNTALPLFPSIDLVAFVGLILSLMAIVFGYDAVCGEKERGTLRLMLSYSVPRHLVLLSKWIGGYVMLIVPFLLTVMVGATIVKIQPDVALDEGQWGRLAVIVGFALLYVAAMYSMSVLVSCLTARSATSVMILLSLWVVLVLAVPNLSPHIARVLRPAANAQEVQDVRRQASEDIWRRLVRQKMEAYDKEHGFGRRWWRNMAWGRWPEMEKYFRRWIYEIECERDGNLTRLEEFARIDQRYGRRMDAQIDLSRWIGRISPFSCFAMAATELADAGIMADTRYMEQLSKYQKDFCNYAHDECLAMEKLGIARQGKYEGAWPDVREKPFPWFHYVPPAANEYVEMVVIEGGILAGMTLLLFMLSTVLFLRYDVR